MYLRSEIESIRDELLVLRCQRGDRDAYDELVRTWQRPLLFYIRRLVASESDAWDVMQETWFKAIRGIHRLRQPRALPLWLYRIARSAAASHYRALDCHEPQYASDVSVEDDVADELMRAENAQQVREALVKLSPSHREVLTLQLLEDFSIDEMSAIVGVPAGTIKSRLHHARHALRSLLSKEVDHV
jgi:RNA polymerase sigma factor (sigma-70 family)